MIMYFAGAEGKTSYELLKKCGVKDILVSAYSLRYKKDLTTHTEKFKRVFLDSGGYSARIRGVIIDVKEYANYINKNKIKLAFNLDTMDIKETLDNQKYLEKNTKAYIVPVYHYSDYKNRKYRSLIDDFIKDYEYISIGGVAGMRLGGDAESLYDYVFNKTRDKVKVHGLGITGESVLKRYPFYSVDSTSWIAPARYGASMRNINPQLKLSIKNNRDSEYRLIKEIEHYKKIGQEATEIWEQRGVKWKT